MATKLEVKNTRAAARTANNRRRKRKRKRNRTLHYMILLVFLIGTGAVLSLTVLFKVEAVEVLGVDKYTPDEVARASGVVLEENLLRINKREIIDNLLEQFPYIEAVEVRRRLPPTVEITVTQAEPVGAISLGDEVVLIDKNGKVLERGVLLVPENVLVIKGINAADVQPGDILGVYTPTQTSGAVLPEAEEQRKERAEVVREQLVMFQYLLRAIEESEFTSLTNVDLTDRLNMRIVYENRITLELGSEADLKDKLDICKSVLDNNIGDNETGTLTPYMNSDKPKAYFNPTIRSSEENTAQITQPVQQETGADAQDVAESENESGE